MAPYRLTEHLATQVILKMKETNNVKDVWDVITKDQGALIKLVGTPVGEEGFKNLAEAVEESYPELLPMVLSLGPHVAMNFTFKLLLEHSAAIKGEGHVPNSTH